MALTRKMLKAFGIEDEKIDEIIEAHAESVEAVKAQRDEYKAEAEKVPALQKQLEEMGDPSEYRDKYDAEHKAFEDYRRQVDADKAEAEKRGLYRDLLKRSGVDPKRLDSVLKVSDLSKVTVKDGAIEGADDIAEGIKADWADFIVSTRTEGASVAKPVTAGGSGAVTAEAFKRMSIRERNRLHETDPDAYRALAHSDSDNAKE